MNCVPRFLRSGRSDWTFLFAGAGRISILSGQLGMSETSWFHGVWVPCHLWLQRFNDLFPGNTGLLESVRQPHGDLWMAEAQKILDDGPRDTERYREIVVRCLEGGSLHDQHLHKVAGAL